MEFTNDYGERMKVWELIRDIKIAIMVTFDDDGTLCSRPMAAQQTEFSGELWFFTSIDSGKIEQIEGNPNVLLGYSSPTANEYVSVKGNAEIVRDRQEVKRLWTELLRVWFPKGPEDSDIALIKVTITSAEYWDAPSGRVIQTFGYVKARLTGQRTEAGTNKVVNF